MKTYECRIDDYFKNGDPLKSNIIALSPSKARYQFYIRHSECLNEYSQCFKYIRSRSLGRVDPSHFFTDVEMFNRVCKSRLIEFAYQGMTVDVSGKKGWIVGGNLHNNLDVFFEKSQGIHNCHPWYDITYYNNDMTIVMNYKNKR